MRCGKAYIVCIYMILTLIAVIMVFPLIYSFSFSLRPTEEIFRYISPVSIRTLIPENVTFENYVVIVRDYGFLQPIVNTLIVCLLAIAFGCLINSIAAMAFAMMEFKGRKLIYAVALLTFTMTFEAISLPMYRIT